VALLLPAAWLTGGLAGLCVMVPAGPDFAWIPMLLLGALVAADLRLSVSAIMALAALLGISHGFLNGSGIGASAGAPEALVGMAGTIFVLVTLVEAAVVASRSMPVRIGVRVLGSWTAATGILLLGWSLR
jgi:hydrogenase/urease accessory protein HupE